MTSSNFDIKSHLRDEALRLRANYDTSSTADLERIAREEYGTRVFRTILAHKCPVSIGSKKAGTSIFYYSLSREVERSILAHEIGHVAAGHLSYRDIDRSSHEEEANYFASQLRDISIARQRSTLLLGGLISVPLLFVSPFTLEREIKRLKDLGVSDDTIARI